MSAAREWARYGICVNAVSFGTVVTPMTEVVRGPKFAAQTLASIPLGRYAETSDVAPGIGFLLAPGSTYITGKKIGRASCRERVCQSVSISVVAVTLKKNTTNTLTMYKKDF